MTAGTQLLLKGEKEPACALRCRVWSSAIYISLYIYNYIYNYIYIIIYIYILLHIPTQKHRTFVRADRQSDSDCCPLGWPRGTWVMVASHRHAAPAPVRAPWHRILWWHDGMMTSRPNPLRSQSPWGTTPKPSNRSWVTSGCDLCKARSAQGSTRGKQEHNWHMRDSCNKSTLSTQRRLSQLEIISARKNDEVLKSWILTTDLPEGLGPRSLESETSPIGTTRLRDGSSVAKATRFWRMWALRVEKMLSKSQKRISYWNPLSQLPSFEEQQSLSKATLYSERTMEPENIATAHKKPSNLPALSRFHCSPSSSSKIASAHSAHQPHHFVTAAWSIRQSRVRPPRRFRSLPTLGVDLTAVPERSWRGSAWPISTMFDLLNGSHWCWGSMTCNH